MRKVILVVEQNVNDRNTMVDMLCAGGYFVMTAADGATALDLARLNPISLMILNPEALQTGWSDFCHQLRKHSETLHVPILLLAASEDEVSQMMKQGTRANGFIVKPFAWEELLGRVRTLLRKSTLFQKVILLVEPDPILRDTITDSLRGEGYFVQIVEDGAAVAGIARDRHISLIVLDPTSPQEGIEICRLVRTCAVTAHVPILMMATDEVEIAQLVRLKLGVNDFLVRPFRWEELRACVRALLRGDKGHSRPKRAATTPKREATHVEAEILVTDALRIDVDQRKVTQGDRQIIFGSKLLFDLLVYLVRHRGDVLTRDQLLQQIWCREGAQKGRTVDVHVHWLRQKLHDNLDNPQLIQTVSGVGYRFIG